VSGSSLKEEKKKKRKRVWDPTCPHRQTEFAEFEGPVEFLGLRPIISRIQQVMEVGVVEDLLGGNSFVWLVHKDLVQQVSCQRTDFRIFLGEVDVWVIREALDIFGSLHIVGNKKTIELQRRSWKAHLRIPDGGNNFLARLSAILCDTAELLYRYHFGW